VGEKQTGSLQRHFGLLHATALNVTMIVGAGVFITIPLMLKELPGPYALLGWLAAGGLMLVDGLIWSELGATMPGSGGSYLYLLECYGRERWGRLMAFLFIWQFLISGPLEIASGLIALAQFSDSLSPGFAHLNQHWSWEWKLLGSQEVIVHLGNWQLPLGNSEEITIAFGPARLLGLGLGVLLIVLLYQRISALGKLTMTFWLGVLAIIGWILVEGFLHFDRSVAFQFSGAASGIPDHFGRGLGAAMRLAMYSYLGYYNVCYIGDEVRDPGRTIPRAIMLSAVLVCVLFVGLHLAMLGTVPWNSMPENLDTYSLPAEFMKRIHGGGWAVSLVTLLLIWSCVGAAFAGLLGYSRIPYGAARYGHFFATLGRVHPVHRIPHVSLLLVGGLTLFWTVFNLQSVIDALIVTRILQQFIGQIAGVILLRQREPDRPRPYRMWFYPVPCGLALIGWLYMYWTAAPLFLALGVVTLLVGGGVFVLWAWCTGGWPFGTSK
jgi:APA family basic amino acid/polyamine antiporter